MSNIIRTLLGIEDPHIKKLKIMNPVVIKGPLEITGDLDYQPKKCEHCGRKNKKSVIKYGWRETKVVIPPCMERKVDLTLSRHNFYCKKCGHTFLAQTPFVQKNHTISMKSRLLCLDKLTETVSMKHIASELGISSTSVMRCLRSYAEDIKPHLNYLPAAICMDEIKTTKSSHGKMSFVFMDAMTHELIDILDSRTLHSLERYFCRYTKAAREAVRVIVTDMNYTYPKLAQWVFPNAIVVMDRFHVVNSAVVGFNQTRIRIMKNYAPSNPKYKALKRYWQLLLKPNGHLNYKLWQHYAYLPGNRTENMLVDELLSFSPELDSAYRVLQSIMTAIATKDLELFDSTINGAFDYSVEMERHLKALRNNQKPIDNALKYPLF
ncbi:ISL3 family transposase [Secundilactobacillus folii]|uniref:ISL3 family transposase n=1 Tax=Secundilactobacillus folii TaxID=2678357 RepID=A0A7X2XXJ0_9LACO|nr:ISL3 family transposase [Secundilactobacillus folii]MTV82176.1 ISL3 family transposase [Secundilactobacillus folii]